MAIKYGDGSQIVTAGLLLYFDAANYKSYTGGATWNDIVGKHVATMHDGVDHQSIYQGVMNYDGTDDRITLPNTVLPNGLGTFFTIEIWNYWNTGSAPTAVWSGSLFTYGGGAGEWIDAGNNNGLVIGFNHIVRRNGSGTEVNTAYSPAPAVQTWHQTVFTLDSGTGNVYVDKVNVMSNNTDFRSNYGQVTGTTGIGIADGPDGGYRGEMKGYIPIVRIYDKVLSTAEIEENFDAFKGRYGL